jgi:hypothetical protein
MFGGGILAASAAKERQRLCQGVKGPGRDDPVYPEVALWRGPLRNLAPRLGVPGLHTFWVFFVDFSKFSKYISLTVSTSGAAQASSNLLPPPFLRCNDLG